MTKHWSAERAIREYVQTNPTTPERVFPLLCPVREAEWVPGWRYRMIYSQSGVAELGCVFTTPNDAGSAASSDDTWVVTEYQPARRIGFVWMRPGLVAARLSFELEPAGGHTRLRARYEYTGLSAEGDAVVQGYTAAWFETKMRRFEAALNHYLETGKMIQGKAWE
jgi:hypothetical protein